MNYPKKPGFNKYQSRHCASIIYRVKTWFLKNLSVFRSGGVDNPVEVELSFANLFLNGYDPADPTIILRYWPSLKNGSNQLIVTLYTLSIYPSVHKQLIRTFFEAHIVRSETNYTLLGSSDFVWKMLSIYLYFKIGILHELLAILRTMKFLTKVQTCTFLYIYSQTKVVYLSLDICLYN